MSLPSSLLPRHDLAIGGKRFRGLSRLVGNTPLLAIEFTFHGRRRVIHAKCEHLNLTGSIKDRMALHILRCAYEQGSIRPGDTIVEATSGNTGIAFAAVGSALGHPVTIFMPSWMSRERVELLQSLGATLTAVSPEEGGFLGSIQRAEEMALTRSDVFLPRQFSNEANVDAHARSTDPELWSQLRSIGLTPHAFVAGVGTGGTVMGVGRYLRERDPSIRIHPIEPAESPTLSRGHRVGKHRIQGISDEFIPPIVQLGRLDSVVAVSDGDAILMAQKLASQLGLAVGISSGANFLGALMVQNELGPDAVVATVFPDDNKKYLTTDLMRHEPERPSYLSTRVRLEALSATKRVCDRCVESSDLVT
jgi:cysteine synthase